MIGVRGFGLIFCLSVRSELFNHRSPRNPPLRSRHSLLVEQQRLLALVFTLGGNTLGTDQRHHRELQRFADVQRHHLELELPQNSSAV